MTRQLMTTAPYTNTFDGALKRAYAEPVKSLLAELFVWYDWLKKAGSINRDPSIRGDMIFFNTTVKRSSAVGARGEMDLLPSIDKVDTVQGYVPFMRGYKGRIGVSAETMRMAKKGKGLFVDVVKQEFDEIMNGLKEHGSSHIWGAGDGTVAKITAPLTGSPGTTLTVTSSEISTGCFPGTRWLAEGQKYIPVTHQTNNTADATWTDAVELSAITSDIEGTIDTSSGLTTAPSYLKSAESASNGSITVGTANSFVGPLGFNAMVDDGTFKGSYCNINEAIYPRWKANILANSGTKRALTLKLFYQAFFKTVRKTGMMKQNLTCFMSPDMYLELVDLLEHFVEFKPRQLDAGFEEVDVMINGQMIKIKLDMFTPGFVYFLNPKEIDFYETIPIEIADEHGNEWIPYQNQDAFEARVRWQWQMATKKRNAHAAIQDITYDVTTL